MFETQLLYTYLIFYVAVGMGAMYEFLFIVSFVLILVTALLTMAYVKDNQKLIVVGKVANVAVTVIVMTTCKPPRLKPVSLKCTCLKPLPWPNWPTRWRSRRLR